jgi:hypothetical protein
VGPVSKTALKLLVEYKNTPPGLLQLVIPTQSINYSGADRSSKFLRFDKCNETTNGKKQLIRVQVFKKGQHFLEAHLHQRIVVYLDDVISHLEQIIN